MAEESSIDPECRLVHCSAAASSSSHTLSWLPPVDNISRQETLVFSSHNTINLACQSDISLPQRPDKFMKVNQTLRRNNIKVENERQQDEEMDAKLTCLCPISNFKNNSQVYSLSGGFSSGAIHIWWHNDNILDKLVYDEEAIVPESSSAYCDISAMQGIPLENGETCTVVVTASSRGAVLHTKFASSSVWESLPVSAHRHGSVSPAVASVKLLVLNKSSLILLTGSAAPRGNRIMVYVLIPGDWTIHPQGSLLGHQDWVTCMAWSYSSSLLATGSHDFKIRLWKFCDTSTTLVQVEDSIIVDEEVDDDASDSEGIDEAVVDDLYQDAARVTIVHNENVSTAILLEALLVGHDDWVTNVSWHPTEPILLSSSMDRSIFIWASQADEGGVWVPISRVGSAGGILGASVGSSLLGFVDAQWSPITGHTIVGHAHGGSLYFWRAHWDEQRTDNDVGEASWVAHPPLTGHFQAVTDLVWEPNSGEYLLTVSMDQTCRLITALNEDNLWHEVARPQVHGYDLTSVCCIGRYQSTEPLHRFVSCADEKQLRVFDAPNATLDLLNQIRPSTLVDTYRDQRVSKAFLPSLGLTNKAGDTHEEITQMEHDANNRNDDKILPLPYERELGVITLWPGKRFMLCIWNLFDDSI